jgi:hypothetical protein
VCTICRPSGEPEFVDSPTRKIDMPSFKAKHTPGSVRIGCKPTSTEAWKGNKSLPSSATYITGLTPSEHVVELTTTLKCAATIRALFGANSSRNHQGANMSNVSKMSNCEANTAKHVPNAKFRQHMRTYAPIALSCHNTCVLAVKRVSTSSPCSPLIYIRYISNI